MRVWRSGSVSAFQADGAGSNPVASTIGSEKSSPAMDDKMPDHKGGQA